MWMIGPSAGQLPIAPVGFYTADSPLVGYLIADRNLHCNFCNFIKVTPRSVIIY
jgi:hypothetical protein